MDLLRLFRQNIDIDTYKQMLREVFKADELLDNSHIEQLPAITDDDKGYYIGNKRTSDRYNIGFFYYEIGRSNVARKKVGLRNLVHKFINSRDGQFDAALVAFKGANHWRLSFICDIKDEATAPKRFTFVFGDADNLYKTPLDRFGKLQQKGITKTNIQDAFSVEALNDQFFADYKAHYEKFCNFLYEHADDPNYFGEEFAHWNSDEKTQKYLRDYVKNLLGRIVFLHFLQKKGWMGVPVNSTEWKGGSQNFMYELFKNSTQSQKENFLDEVLESLFFNCLNTDRSEDNDVYDTKVAAIGKVRIPYLNGELFEEGFLDTPKSKFSVELFENLFNLFNSYNFTIDENDPSDAEIGVDPEMLGKIFENLLEDNKDKGAFYTPKEIVSYMCKESLIAYLQSKIGKAHHDSIRTLVSTHLKDQHLEEDQNVCGRLNKALRDVKVCDPAIGSGAFPMGLLNEIFACRCQLETTDKPKSELKGEIIQNNIYGVDIERGAVDIARLRFWLALIVDAEKPVPLPNLDYKIMQGNSLLESYKGQDLTKFMENAFAQPFAIQLNKDLKKYFKETDNEEKLRLRKSIDYTIKQCIFQCGIQDDIELPNTDFFLWHTYFKDVFDEGGFDIVIGNPPYIRHEKLDIEYKRLLCSVYPNVGEGTADILVYFFGLGINILSRKGILNFITSNKFLKTKYGKNLRNTLASDVDVLSFIDFFELPVFNNASTDAGITLLRNDIPTSKTKYYPVLSLKNLDLDALTKGAYQHTIKTETEWQFVRPEECSILNKLNENSISLTDFVNNRIYSGVKTGLNGTFMLTKEVRDMILSKCLSEDEYNRTDNVIKKAFRSRDIRKYVYRGPQIWLLFIPWHFPLPFEEAEDMKPQIALELAEQKMHEDYPSLYSYLCDNKKNLSGRNKDETGIRYEWYALQRWGAKYYWEFDEEKLIYIHTAKNHEFYYDTDKHYVNNSCYIIASQSKFLYCFLNSKLFNYFKRIKFVAYGNGAEAGRCKLDGNKMATVPIRIGVDESLFKEKFERIQSLIKSNPQADTTALEREIDHLIYELYGLTNGEVKIIDPDETTVGSDDDLFKA